MPPANPLPATALYQPLGWAGLLGPPEAASSAAPPRMPRRSIMLGSEPSLDSGERPVRSERISPPSGQRATVRFFFASIMNDAVIRLRNARSALVSTLSPALALKPRNEPRPPTHAVQKIGRAHV